MAEPPRSPGLQLAGTREFLLPFCVTVCFVLYYLLDAPGWLVIVIAVPAVTLYLMAPGWAERSIVSFDRDLVRLLSTGQRSALRARYLRAIGMRLFAPPALRAERSALVAAENGLAAEACAGYRIALEQYGGRAPLRVLLGYAHACHAVENDAEAIRVYRELLAQVGGLPSVRRRLAHSLVRRGEALREALELIADEATLQPGQQAQPELGLLRALAHAKLGERERARELLAESDHAHGEVAAALRRDLEQALDGASEARPA